MIHIQDRIQMCIAKIIQNNSEVKNIFDEIYQSGGRVILVGGAVRDCFLGCVGSDLDFEVYHLSFEEIQDILQKFGKVNFIGKTFGVLRLHGINADWSIPRADSCGRKPLVEFDPHMSFAQAFRRRDLTMNAMGIDVYSQELIDPFTGCLDLKNKILRSPDLEFFVQDPLRLFRVMQFKARFGMEVDESLSAACKEVDISALSCERIEQEFTKMFLKSYRPSLGFAWLSYINRVQDIFPNVSFDNKFHEIIDCIAQGYDFTDEQKLFAMWGLVAYGLQRDTLQELSIDKKISCEQISQISSLLKKYIGSQDLVGRACMLSWYVRYVPLLAGQLDLIKYKWLAHWIEPYFTMEALGMIARCYFSKDIAETFLDKAQIAKVFYKAEAPLLIGKDLGDLVKKAYEVQLNESVIDKQKLFQKIMPS